MKYVHFLVDKSRIVDYLTTPLRVNKRQLRERGYHVRFFYRLSDKCLSCDVLGLVSKPVFKLLEERQMILDSNSATVRLLRRARRHAAKVVWFDSSDSTGVTHFELLPYVNLYLKKQLLKDKTLYQRPLYGGRLFADYYHRVFGVEDREPFAQCYPLHEEFFPKVQLSWNMALGEVYHAFTLREKIRRAVPGLIHPRLHRNYSDPYSQRRNDLFIRASTEWPRETVAFHRKELIRRLDSLLKTHPTIRGSVRGRLPLKVYRQRQQNTKIAFGPFGWGELNMREYEALIAGCLLMRPDLGHMATWPDIFHDGETCVYYRWDFADLEERILQYLRDERLRQPIAANGQEAYKDCISENGMERFCEWVIQQIEK